METPLRRIEGGAVEMASLHCCRFREADLPLDTADLAARLCELFDRGAGIQRNECRQLIDSGRLTLRINGG